MSSSSRSASPDQNKLDARALDEHARGRPESAGVVARMRELLAAPDDPFSRRHTEPGHFTASAFVLCPERRRVLLIHHRKLGRWLQPGGHIEAADADLAAAARREVSEETGVDVDGPFGGIFDVDIHDIPANSKDAAHQHFDVRYAFVARSDRLEASPEVLGARWVELSAVAQLTDEDSVLRCTERLRAARF
ncbi:MAG TPA: NUDIX hydrolase [Polyangiaceae bacterium]|nr:NUDIX hydrolase [Polyangiaceae bacterium]